VRAIPWRSLHSLSHQLIHLAFVQARAEFESALAWASTHTRSNAACTQANHYAAPEYDGRLPAPTSASRSFVRSLALLHAPVESLLARSVAASLGIAAVCLVVSPLYAVVILLLTGFLAFHESFGALVNALCRRMDRAIAIARSARRASD
jgi:hypothetical protein